MIVTCALPGCWRVFHSRPDRPEACCSREHARLLDRLRADLASRPHPILVAQFMAQPEIEPVRRPVEDAWKRVFEAPI